MTDRAIIFSESMVSGLLNGRKTQTRRLQFDGRGRPTTWARLDQEWRNGHRHQRLWVRENTIRTPAGIAYAADGGRHYDAGERLPVTSSIHMPRRASRLTLDVADVRVQRLQEITEEDARAEGYDTEIGGPRNWFCVLWKCLHGNDAWDANPSVVAINFHVRRRNIDA